MAGQVFLQESVETPTGLMLLLTDAQQRVCAADWLDKEQRLLELVRRYYPGDVRIAATDTVSPARLALQAYFEGERGAIDALPVAMAGTAFQRLVWTALRAIPCGQTLSYGALAQRIGRPTASRAVGLANGSNPISVIVPCHRVIGANAALTGYGGGIERKRWLLEHEGARLSATTPQLVMALE